VVDQRGQQDAEDDGQRLLEACGEDEGEQLRLVADFGQRDDACGDQESFHEESVRAGD